MYNFYTKFVKTLEICKQFSEKLVNESGNVPHRGPVPKFSDLYNTIQAEDVLSYAAAARP